MRGFDDRRHFASIAALLAMFDNLTDWSGLTDEQRGALIDGRQCALAGNQPSVPIRFMREDLAQWWAAGYDGKSRP